MEKSESEKVAGEQELKRYPGMTTQTGMWEMASAKGKAQGKGS